MVVILFDNHQGGFDAPTVDFVVFEFESAISVVFCYPFFKIL
jgi:hypothetical protein